MARIVVVGSSNTDMVVKCRRFPGPGETILGGDFFMAAGGKGANQAVAAKRAGAEVALVGAVGEDVFGAKALEGFGEAELDVSGLVRLSDVPSGVALILVDESGENTIVVAPGANMALTPEHVDAAAEAIRACDVLLMCLEVPIETVCRAADIAAGAGGGAKVVLNPAPAPTDPLPADLLSKVSVLTPNRQEFGAITGAAPSPDGDWASVRKLLESGCDAAVLTLGGEGAVVVTRDGAEHVPPFRVEAVDTVGCGDAFNGALAVAIAEGRPLPEAARFAAAAGALAATKLGAQPSMPSRGEIERMLGS